MGGMESLLGVSYVRCENYGHNGTGWMGRERR